MKKPEQSLEDFLRQEARKEELKESRRHIDINMSVFEKAMWLTFAIFCAATLLILFAEMLVHSLVEMGVL